MATVVLEFVDVIIVVKLVPLLGQLMSHAMDGLGLEGEEVRVGLKRAGAGVETSSSGPNMAPVSSDLSLASSECNVAPKSVNISLAYLISYEKMARKNGTHCCNNTNDLNYLLLDPFLALAPIRFIRNGRMANFFCISVSEDIQFLFKRRDHLVYPS